MLLNADEFKFVIDKNVLCVERVKNPEAGSRREAEPAAHAHGDSDSA